MGLLFIGMYHIRLIMADLFCLKIQKLTFAILMAIALSILQWGSMVAAHVAHRKTTIKSYRCPLVATQSPILDSSNHHGGSFMPRYV